MVLRSVQVDPDADGTRRSIKQNPLLGKTGTNLKCSCWRKNWNNLRNKVSRRTGSPGEQGQTRNSPKVNGVTGANKVILDYIRVTRANGNPGT